LDLTVLSQYLVTEFGNIETHYCCFGDFFHFLKKQLLPIENSYTSSEEPCVVSAITDAPSQFPHVWFCGPSLGLPLIKVDKVLTVFGAKENMIP